MLNEKFILILLVAFITSILSLPISGDLNKIETCHCQRDNW